MALAEPTESNQTRINREVWRGRNNVRDYANRVLRPVEVVLLMRYQQQLSGRVLDAGCGAGRVLGYLVALGGEVHGIDVSTSMTEYCRRAYPEAHVGVGDLAALSKSVTGPFDAVIVADSTLDVFDDAQRRAVLADIRELLGPGGVLIFSSHNLDHADGKPEAVGGAPRSRAPALLELLTGTTPRHAVGEALRLPRRIRNRRRLAPLQSRAADHAILN
ncbi:MAG TPA: class I SAM-dependent methyltransferase, partial [Solirubrobacteraceae bacterium]